MAVDRDALVARVREHCMTKEGAWEDHPWDEVAFKVGKKLFCIVGEDVFLCASPDEQAVLIQNPIIRPAPYLAKHGWIVIKPENDEDVLVALDLIDRSYERVVSKLPKKRT